MIPVMIPEPYCFLLYPIILSEGGKVLDGRSLSTYTTIGITDLHSSP